MLRRFFFLFIGISCGLILCAQNIFLCAATFPLQRFLLLKKRIKFAV